METATSTLMLMPTSCYTCTRILQFSHFPHFPFAMGNNTFRGEDATGARPLMSSKIISKSILQQMRQHVERSWRRGEREREGGEGGEVPHSTLATLTEAPLTAGGTGEGGATLRLTFINCKAK